MTSFVTGGTGFIGANVIRALLAEGERVRALVQPGSNRANLEGLDLEIIEGDLSSVDTLARGMEGCHRVYHVAALYTFWPSDRDALHRANVEGTRHVLEACRRQGVERIVYTSSVAALAVPIDTTPVTEQTPIDPERIIGAYKRSKYDAEQVALEAAAAGMPVVIVNPSYPVGPYDIKPTPSGRMIVDFLNGRMPAFVDTGMNIVDVEAVAQGHLLAAKKGRVGERYILGGENLRMGEVLALLSEITGRPAPRLRLPHRPLLALSYLNAGWARLTGKTPRMTPDTIRMSAHPMFYDSSKAVRDLGFSLEPAHGSLEKAVRWFAKNGYVS